MVQIKKDIIRNGEMTSVKVKKRSILIAQVEGEFYAMDNICPHLRCHLDEGSLKGTIVRCPCHGSTFDVTNGKLVTWIEDWPRLIGKITRLIGLARDVRTYPCAVEGDSVTIEI